MADLWKRLCFAFILIQIAFAINKEDLYPYGIQNQDRRLQAGDDISSEEIFLQSSIPVAFYDDYFNSLYVNSNGHISFETELPSYRGNLILPFGYRVIAIFLSDVDTSLTGNVFYRETQDPSLLNKAGQAIRQNFGRGRTFQPQSLFIATWVDVGYYDSQYDRVNTFQLVIASDGTDSYAMFHYPQDGLQWLQSQGKSQAQAPDVPGQAGFDAGDQSGRASLLPRSGYEEVGNLARESNVNVAGVWMFKIGNTYGGNVIMPDIPTAGGGGSGPQSCDAGGADRCHADARCSDYSSGYCCECISPNFGNGVNCLEEGKPQRVNGKVKGVVNGYTIDNEDLHSYLVSADGRTFTAISRVAPDLGFSLQSLYMLTDILGWLFAIPQSAVAKNGYMITGGDFNRSATVTFADSQAQISVRQSAVGRDARGYMRMSTNLNGNIPNLPVGAKLTVQDYHVEFRRTTKGEIKGHSTRTFTVDGVSYRYTVSETISYKECDANPLNDLPNQRLNVARAYVVYGEDEEVVRYATTNEIGRIAGGDQCVAQGLRCDSHADCVPSGSYYRCQCQEGYSGDGSICTDIDECRRNLDQCHENAECTNTQGGHSCKCSPGYTGNGYECQRDTSCGEERCDDNADCVYDSSRGPFCQCLEGYFGTGVQCYREVPGYCGRVQCDREARCVRSRVGEEPYCECNPGFVGDGERCDRVEFTCNEVNTCDINAECVFDLYERKYVCECADGFSGDGYYCTDTGEVELNCDHCDANAQCEYDLYRLTFLCVCNAGFTGDGNTCTRIEDTTDQCQSNGDCGRNADCVYEQNTRRYECRCQAGYVGDGFRCDIEGCDTARNCDDNAECVFSDRTRRYECVCNNGFRGNGYECEAQECDQSACDENARCAYDESLQRYRCTCNDGYFGDGFRCEFEGERQCNQVNDCDPNAQCLYDSRTGRYRCECNSGYEGDGFRCQPKADCSRDPNMCDVNARCERRGRDFVCVCNPGFRGDGERCISVEGDGDALVVMQGQSILQVPLDPSAKGKLILHVPGQMGVGVDVDCRDQYIYWTDVAGKSISRTRMDGTDTNALLTSLESPEGVAIDFLGRNMYFTDSELDFIGVADLDGTFHHRLHHSDLVNPRAIAVDPLRGFLFWADWNRAAPKIERSNMDGTDRRAIVTDELALPNGLFVEPASQELCWADAGTQKIECVNYEGRGRREIYNQAQYPFDITFANNNYYWTDWEMQSLPMVDGYSSRPGVPLSLPPGGNGKVYGIAQAKTRCPRASNACSNNNGGCRFLCLPSGSDRRQCVCPDSISEEECNELGLVL